MQNALLLWLALSGCQVLLSSFNFVWFAIFLRYERSATVVLLTMVPLSFMVLGIIHMRTLQGLGPEGSEMYLKEAPAWVMFLFTAGVQTASIIWHYRRILKELKEQNGRKQE